jgi:hypothetical protein
LIGILAEILFIVIERRHPAPLVPPAAVARRAVLTPNGAILMQSMVGVAWRYLLTFYLQDLRGLDPLISGLWFTPMTVASVLAAVAATASQAAIDETALTSGFLTCLACVVPALVLVAIGSRDRSRTTPDLRQLSRSG